MPLGDLARGTADVLVALPRLLSAPLYRHWHLRWGATDAEVAAAMAGDELYRNHRSTPPGPSPSRRRPRTGGVERWFR